MNLDATALLQDAATNHKLGNYPAALMQYRVYLSRNGENLSAWECYSSLLLTMERFEDCLEACRRALAINPNSRLATYNIATTLVHLLNKCVVEERTSEIQTYADQLIGVQSGGCPDNADWVGSHTKLLIGDFEEGWRLYESRLRQPDFNGQGHLLAAPMWDGKPYQGKTLLLHGEQGYGDTIMMLRYLERVKALGGTLLVYVQPPLLDVARSCPGPDYIFEKEQKIPFDVQLPMMSLPRIFNTNIDTIPSHNPYISLPEHAPNMEQISFRLNNARHSKKRGLVWAGRPTHKRDAERSIPPELLAPLEAAKDASWFCLQRDAPDAIPFPGAAPLGDLFETFADTAYALSKLDALVTVDTAIAHLAGAMGIPTMLLVSFLPDWRWLLARGDSPWYPSIKIYRQQNHGDWPSVIQRVAEDLRL